jgi:hypothetical protein
MLNELDTIASLIDQNKVLKNEIDYLFTNFKYTNTLQKTIAEWQKTIAENSMRITRLRNMIGMGT